MCMMCDVKAVRMELDGSLVGPDGLVSEGRMLCFKNDVGLGKHTMVRK